MTALAKDRNTVQRHGPGRAVSYLVDASTTIYAGSLVMLLAGYLKPAADTALGIVVGIADEKVDNSGGAAGAKRCTVVAGIAAKLVNNAGAVVQADVGKSANVIDDQTITDAATTNNIVAGKIEEIDDDGGIWVWIA